MWAATMADPKVEHSVARRAASRAESKVVLRVAWTAEHSAGTKAENWAAR